MSAAERDASPGGASPREVERTASLSRDGRYRYALGRRWGDGPSVTWVMLNPSTADYRQDDPTIRRCMAFSRAWGFGAMTVVNLFALRSPEPRALLDAADLCAGLLGPGGARALRSALRSEWGDASVVAAWGNLHPRLAEASEAARALVPEGTWCLGVTGRGEPRHPLYVRGDALPRPWRRAGSRAPSEGVWGEGALSVFGAQPTMAA